MDFKFVKFTNFAKELLKGEIYLNSLEYYRGIETIASGQDIKRNVAVNDFLEGAIASVNKKDLYKIGLEDLEKELGDALIGNVHLLSEDFKYFKLFCLYALLFDRDRRILVKPSKKLYEFGCQYAVVIENVKEFRDRLFRTLQNNIDKYKIFETRGGFVEYYKDDEKSKKLGPFNKTSDFFWQHEFRFIFREINPNLNPSIINIGDISDIAYLINAEELIENPQKIWSNYTMSSVSDIV